MIAIDNVLVSDEVIEEEFVCNLAACRGACCVQGDGGAPLTAEEARTVEAIYEHVEPYMNDAGRQAVGQKGLYTVQPDGTFATPMVGEAGPCAYVHMLPNGQAACGIEMAYRAGTIDFYKPISCHLYPIRISDAHGFEMLNYDRWDICSPACANGKKHGVRVFEFVRTALERKYGAVFYDRLKEAVAYLESEEG
ncbi:MAG: DUF3109 family protein [Bacteroidota bacterium]